MCLSMAALHWDLHVAAGMRTIHVFALHQWGSQVAHIVVGRKICMVWWLMAYLVQPLGFVAPKSMEVGQPGNRGSPKKVKLFFFKSAANNANN